VPRDRTATTPDDFTPARGVRAPAPYLFRVLACEDPSTPPGRHRLDGLELVTFGRGALGSARGVEGARTRLSLTVPDPRASTRHARLSRALGRWIVEDEGSKNGTLVNGARVETAALGDGDLLEIGRTFFLFRASVEAAPDLPEDRDEPFTLGSDGTATVSPSLEKELASFAEVVRSAIPVLLLGETGTGKELLARALHAKSGRTGELVAVNCGALPTALVESELFGYRRGAFSDAREDRAGLVRSADGGTLFLDEIGDLAPAAQAALLRVLQEREVMPVGGTRPMPVDFRLCSATHRDLAGSARGGGFRADLLARVAGAEVRLPPLRERLCDLGLLVTALSRKHAGAPVRLAAAAARALLSHRWPLNVRELETAVAVAIAHARGGAIESEHLPESVRAAPEPRAKPARTDDPRRAELERLLAENDGNLSAVARALGKDRVQIRRWLKRYGLDGRRAAR
jgi:transcriptional regulator of acetoin/glycerol metabolism